MEETQYTIIKAKMEDRDQILEFLRKYFYTEEPINAAMNKRFKELSAADEQDTLELLKEDISFLAISNNDKDQGTLLGICLSGSVVKNESEHLEDIAATCGCPRFAKLLNFLMYVELKAGVWMRSKVDRGLSVQALATKPETRGLGIGLALLLKTRDVAQRAGYPLFRLDCSSCFSARLAEQMGMEFIYSLPYSQYKDENGIPVFDVNSPHSEMKVYIQKLV